MQNLRIGLVTFGEVGTGKSTLCNTLISLDGSPFIECKKTKAQTFETIGKEGNYDGQKIFLIDTPGLGDAERNDPIHLVQMARYIKHNKLIKGFIMNRKCTLSKIRRQGKKTFMN